MIRSRGQYRRLKRLTLPLIKHHNSRSGALLWDDSFNPTTTIASILSFHILIIVIVVVILLALSGSAIYFYRISESSLAIPSIDTGPHLNSSRSTATVP